MKGSTSSLRSKARTPGRPQVGRFQTTRPQRPSWAGADTTLLYVI